MRSFQVIGFLLLFGSVANGGIAYQWSVDGTGGAVDISAGSGSWSPVSGNTSVSWSGSNSSNGLNNGSSGNLYIVDNSTSASHRIDASIASSTELGAVTGLIQAANLNASDGKELYSNGGFADGYVQGSTNYFGWAAYSTSGGDSLIALGWASFIYVPDTDANGAGAVFNNDTFRILDWAYTTDATDSVTGNASFAAGITAGTTAADQGSSTSGVPEPTGFAILGLAGLVVASSKRRRR